MSWYEDPEKKRLPLSLDQQAQVLTGAILLLILFKGALLSPWFYSLTGVVAVALLISGFTGRSFFGHWLISMPWNQKPIASWQPN